MFTAPGSGMRLICDADQLACFEFAATHWSESMRRLLFGVRPGLTELSAFTLFAPIGLPYSYHPTLLSGERAALGLASPSGRVLALGDPVRLSDPWFGVHLNPGHFIHLDEWPSSPVYAGSAVPLQSGMALQLDIIPATGTVYHTSNIEDGVALADAALRSQIAARYPQMWERVRQRRSFMAEVLGISLKPEVLPLSNLAGYLPPFWLSPQLAMRRK